MFLASRFLPFETDTNLYRFKNAPLGCEPCTCKLKNKSPKHKPCVSMAMASPQMHFETVCVIHISNQRQKVTKRCVFNLCFLFWTMFNVQKIVFSASKFGTKDLDSRRVFSQNSLQNHRWCAEGQTLCMIYPWYLCLRHPLTQFSLFPPWYLCPNILGHHWDTICHLVSWFWRRKCTFFFVSALVSLSQWCPNFPRISRILDPFGDRKVSPESQQTNLIRSPANVSTISHPRFLKKFMKSWLKDLYFTTRSSRLLQHYFVATNQTFVDCIGTKKS